jgi:hypothetical protein
VLAGSGVATPGPGTPGVERLEAVAHRLEQLFTITISDSFSGRIMLAKDGRPTIEERRSQLRRRRRGGPGQTAAAAVAWAVAGLLFIVLALLITTGR